MLPHCAVHMLRTISLHLFRAPLNGCRFWDGLSCFSVWRGSPHPSLQQAFCGMPPLPSQPFGVTCVLKNGASHDLTFPFLTSDPRFVRNWESNNRTSPLLTTLLCQHLAFFRAWARMNICNGSDYPEEYRSKVPPSRGCTRGCFL